MYFNLLLFYGYLHPECSWVRWRPSGRGLVLTRQPPLFSERFGYVKAYKIGFGWRVKFLKD